MFGLIPIHKVAASLLLSVAMLQQPEVEKEHIRFAPVLVEAARDTSIVSKVEQATYLLYGINKSGPHPHCTTWLFDKKKVKNTFVYFFASAGHCYAKGEEHGIKFDQIEGQKDIILPASILYAKDAEDVDYMLAAVEFKGDLKLKPLELGDERDLKRGDEVFSISFLPAFYKSYLYGRLSKISMEIDYPVEGTNWKNMVVLNMNSGPGSSGSAVISTRTGEVIGILIGGSTEVRVEFTFATPISRFKSLLQARAKGQNFNGQIQIQNSKSNKYAVF